MLLPLASSSYCVPAFLLGPDSYKMSKTGFLVARNRVPWGRQICKWRTWKTAMWVWVALCLLLISLCPHSSSKAVFSCVPIVTFFDCLSVYPKDQYLLFLSGATFYKRSHAFLHENIIINDLCWFSIVPEYELPSFLVLLTSAGKPLPLVCFCFSALNGYLFGNFPEPDMCVGESVSWHLFGMGNEIDIHSIYFYGNTFISRGHRTDVVNLFPATFLTTEMIAENPGKWMITCQVSDHLQGKRTKTSVEMLAMGQ